MVNHLYKLPKFMQICVMTFTQLLSNSHYKSNKNIEMQK